MTLTRFKHQGAVIVLVAVMAAMFAFTADASAQQRRHKRSFWNRHRTAITIGGGTLAGAGVGGLIGGRKGAVIGAVSGAGGSTIYEVVRHKRRHRNN